MHESPTVRLGFTFYSIPKDDVISWPGGGMPDVPEGFDSMRNYYFIISTKTLSMKQNNWVCNIPWIHKNVIHANRFEQKRKVKKSIGFLLTFSLLFCMQDVLLGQYTWKGVNTNWNDPANYIDGALMNPANMGVLSNQDITIPSAPMGGNFPSTSSGPAVMFRSLLVQNTGAGTVIIPGSFTLTMDHATLGNAMHLQLGAKVDNNGTLVLHDATNGLRVDFGATIRNFNTLNVAMMSNNGVDLLGTGLNTGTWNITTVNGDGLQVFINGSFQNASATLNITDADLRGIYNNGLILSKGVTSKLNINQTLREGILNGGFFINATGSTVNICDAGNGVIKYPGVRNENSFINGNDSGAGNTGLGSTLNIQNTGSHGIYNFFGTFFNMDNDGGGGSRINIGIPVISGCPVTIGAHGILNTANFLNRDISTIEIANTTLHGIDNRSVFNNTQGGAPVIAGGTILIHTTGAGKSGILNELGATLTNANNGFIQIDNNPENGILNQGDINNSATIQTLATTLSGIHTVGMSTILNTGTILTNSSGVSMYGILMMDASVITNMSTGKINLLNSTNYGLATMDATVFNNKNSGTKLTITNPTKLSIFNSGAAINNTDCAVILTDGKITNETTFNNEAILETTFQGTNMATVSVANTGVVVDKFNAFHTNLIDRLADASLIVNTTGIMIVQDTLCPATISFGATTGNIIIQGATPPFNFVPANTWYYDAGLTMVAGTYNAITNSFTFINPPTSGANHVLYFNVNSGACNYTACMRIRVRGLADLMASAYTDPEGRVVCDSSCGMDGLNAKLYSYLFKAEPTTPEDVEFELVSVDQSMAPGLTRSTLPTGLPNGGRPLGYRVCDMSSFAEYLKNTTSTAQTIKYKFIPHLVTACGGGGANDVCDGDTVTLKVFVWATPEAVVAPSDPAMVCEGATINVIGIPLPSPPYLGPITHKWWIPDPQPAGFTGNAMFVDMMALPVGIGSFTSNQTGTLLGKGAGKILLLYNFCSADGCSQSVPDSLVVEVLDSPNINPIAGGNPICPGKEQNYSVTNVPGNTYLWSLSSGGVITNGVNTNIVTVQWSDSLGGPHILTLKETNPKGCMTVNTMQINIVAVESDPVCPTIIPNPLLTGNDLIPGDCAYTFPGKNFDVSVAPGTCGILSTSWLEPASGKNGTTLQNQSFGLGAHNITWTVKYLSGTTKTCSQTFNVSDNEVPKIICPHNISVNNDGTGLDVFSTLAGITVDISPVCGVKFSNIKPGIIDNCVNTKIQWSATGAIPALGMGVMNNVQFPGGSTNITFQLVDTAGNMSATCITQVNIVDVEKPTITCPGPTYFTSSQNFVGNCAYLIPNTSLDATATDACGGMLTIEHNYNGGGPSLKFESIYVGTETITWTATDANGNTSTCSHQINVEDDELPVVFCNPSLVIPITQVNTPLPSNYLLPPIWTDNCGSLQSIIAYPSVFHCDSVGKMFNITVEATDIHGNVGSCKIKATIVDTTKPELMKCPVDITVSNDIDKCGAYVNFAPPMYMDLCSSTLKYYYWTTGATVMGGGDIPASIGLGDSNPNNDPLLANPVGSNFFHPSGKFFNIGNTVVKVFSVDNSNNISLVCTFTITVKDAQLPILVKCPADLTVNTNPGTCKGTVPDLKSQMIATDNCTLTTTQFPLPGTLFGMKHGDTVQVIISKVDSGMHVIKCTTIVTLRDNIAPEITSCPLDQILNNVSGKCEWLMPNLLGQADAIDNCIVSNKVQYPTPGTPILKKHNDTVQVTITFSDLGGNSVSCTRVITLKDSEAPVILCPPSITVACPAIKAIVAKPLVSDNCNIKSIKNSINNTDDASGFYPPGKTTVTWTIEDSASNVTQCQMMVTVDTLPWPTVAGEGTHCINYVPNVIVTTTVPGGTFKWFKDAALTIPVPAAQISGANNNTYKPMGNVGVEIVYVQVMHPVNGCLSTARKITLNIVACEVSLTDPCNCMDNATTTLDGQFNEALTVTAPPGQIWYIKSVNGLYRPQPFSPAPPAAPVPFTTGPGGQLLVETTPGKYSLSGIHIDSIGYTITLSNGVVDLTGSNQCYYPNPKFNNLFNNYCVNYPAVTLSGSATYPGLSNPNIPDPAVAQGQNFMITNSVGVVINNNATTFNPALLGPGTYTVKYTFDAADAPDTKRPGCIQSISQVVKVFQEPPSDLFCGSVTNVSLDESGCAVITAAHILQGNYGCFDQYLVEVEGHVNNKVDCNDAGTLINVKIIDPISGNFCWGKILVEDKMAPTITCSDVTVNCNENSLLPGSVGFPVFKDNCGLNTLVTTYSESINNVQCDPNFVAIISRTWFATDKAGNSALPCTQKIFLRRNSVNEVVFPPNKDDVASPSVNCKNANTTPASTGMPTLNGKPIGGYCEMSANYSDQTFPICENSYKILRTWTVMDQCFNSMTSAVQIIKVLDKTGPQMVCPKPENIIVTPTFSTCEATVTVPASVINDDCSSVNNIPVSLSVFVNGIEQKSNKNGGTFILPYGIHTFVFRATDACGNTSTCSVVKEVKDLVPPTNVCIEKTVVSLVNSTTYVDAKFFDKGSYDNCSAVTYLVRRMDNPKCAGNDESQFDTSVPLYCCDVANGPVILVLRVTDKDGNYNDCMVEVTVQDKQAPIVTCPADITLTCNESDTPSDPIKVNFKTTPNQKITAIAPLTYTFPINVTGVPANGKVSDVNLLMKVDHESVDQLTIKLTDPAGTTSTIFVGGTCGITAANMDVTWDDSGSNFNCGSGDPTIKGKLKPKNGAMNVFNGTVPTGNWIVTIIDGAVNGGGLVKELELQLTISTPLTDKPLATDNAAVCGISYVYFDLNKPVQCPGGKEWQRQWVATDKSGNAGFCFQKIQMVDNTPLQVNFPEDVTVTGCVALNSLPATGNVTHNGDCELVAINKTDEVLNVVQDACYKILRTWTVVDWCKFNTAKSHTDLGIVINADGHVYQDDGDGYFKYVQVIKVIDDIDPVFVKVPVDTIICTDLKDCSAIPVKLGVTVSDDCAPVNSLKVTYQLDVNKNGTYDFTGNGNTFMHVIPIGIHHVRFVVTDGCANSSEVEFDFTVKDCKKPTPICINGISAPLMPTCMVQLWAKDFEAGSSSDNCTQYSNLKFCVAKLKDFAGNLPLPEPNLAFCKSNVTFDSTELGKQGVALYVQDEAGNWDYCLTFVDIQGGQCKVDTAVMSYVMGNLTNDKNEGVSDAVIDLTGSGMTPVKTDNSGFYKFKVMGKGGSYTIQPEKKTNPLNGVNTYDLVLIQKHLLNITKLNSPYKLIAADVTNDKKISVSDIVELRKLILKAIPDFVKNTSWKFLEKNYVFTDPTNPWLKPLPEFCPVQNLSGTVKADFIGVKIGDIDGTALANKFIQSEDRSANATIFFETDDQFFTAGERVKIQLHLPVYEKIEGMQGTLQFDPSTLEFIQLTGDQKWKEEQFGIGGIEEGLIAFSHEQSLTESGNIILEFIAKKSGRLSQVLSINSEWIAAEAYVKGEPVQIAGVGVNFRQDGKPDEQESYLLQNVPNPFSTQTRISFHLSKDAHASVTLYDVTGRVIKAIAGDYTAGTHHITVTAEELGVKGVLYYALQTDDYSSTKQMLIIE